MANTPWRRDGVKLEVDAGVEHSESVAVPSAPGAGKGTFWVETGTPTLPKFTDSAGNNFTLNESGGSSGTAGVVYQNLQFYVDPLNQSSYPGTGTAVIDLKGNATAGTLTTAVYQNGGFQFNGTSGNLTFTKDAANDNIFTGGGTVIVFFQANSDGENSAARVITTENAGATGGWALYVDAEGSDYIRPSLIRMGSGANGVWVVDNIGGLRPVHNGTWVCVGISWDDTAFTTDPVFYLQGTRVASTETIVPSGTPGSDAGESLLLGNRPADDRTFDGTVGIALMFDRILSAEEHALVFSVFGPRYGSGLQARPQQTAGLPGSDVKIAAGDFLGTTTTAGSNGGDLTVRAGHTASGGSGSIAGNLYLYAGSAVTSAARGGAFILKGGSGFAGGVTACEVGAGTQQSGNGAGVLVVHGGDNSSTGSAGDLTCRGGNSVSGIGGDLYLTGGLAGIGDAPGDVILRSGENANGFPQTGTILISTDRAVGLGGGTGNIDIETGENDASSSPVGTLTLRGGNAAGSGPAGSIVLVAGANTSPSSGTGGGISLTAGNSVDNPGGGITCVAGSSTSTDISAPAGSFSFTAGNQTGTGTSTGSGGGGFTFTAGSSAKSATASPGGSFTVTGGAGTANSASSRGGDVNLTAGAVTGTTAGALAGSVTLTGGAASVGTNGRISLLTSNLDAPVGHRTQSTFTGTIKEELTRGLQISLPPSSQTTLLTLGTLTVSGRNMKVDLFASGMNNSAVDEQVSLRLIQLAYRTAGGSISPLTAHLDDSQNSGAGNFAADVTFNLSASGNDIILRAQNANGVGVTYTANISVWWSRQEGGFSS